MDRAAFFSAVRSSLFGGSMSTGQVSGTEAILDQWDTRKLTDLRWLGYVLATAKWETDQTMQPIAEIGKGKGHPYGQPGKDGQIAYGRGYVQLTWDYNYVRADNELRLGGKLIANYELALDPEIAAAILFGGMIGGWFTGRKLADYFTDSTADWLNARRIVNRTDKAAIIAGYAKAFYAALQAAAASPVPKPAPVTPPPPQPKPWVPPTPTPPLSGSQKTTGIIVLILAALGALWAWASHLFGG